MTGVSLRLTALLAVAVGGYAIALPAQNQSGSALEVQVNPEAHLDTPVVPLSFQLDNPGDTVSNQPVTITAWVRSLPGQQIQLAAQVAALTGHSGAVPASAIRWSGSMASATGGAVPAVCTAGDFSAGGLQQLISGWTQSGIAKCTVTFALATGVQWPAGSYTGEVNLSLSER